jgi:hypothetical protein
MSGSSSNKKFGKQRTGTGKRYTDNFLGFVDIELSAKDREDLEALVFPGQVDLVAFLVQVIEDGYKFSLSGDVEHSSSIATLTGKAAACENKGYALSGRGPDPHGAMVVLWYKHTVLANWGKWTEEGTVADNQLPLWR